MDSDKWTDAELERLEKRIREEYDKAQKELGEKAAAYFQEYEERFKREELAMLTSSLSKDEVESKWVDIYGTNAGFETWYRKADHAYGQDEYQAKLNFRKWEMAQLGRGQHWYDMRDQMAQRLTEANQIAAGYINNVLPGIYVANSNGVAKIAQDAAMEQGIMGVRFDLVDEYTVRNLMVESSDVRPYKPVNISIDESSKWSKNKLQNALLQGILQGDSIGDIADRFETVTGMNRNAAIRNARTATTNAQNAGKQDRFADLASKGCIFNKMWIATHDERTRDEHRDADRQEVDYNSTFDVGGEDLMYPGDPSASGWNRYNCRCTMRASNIRFKSMKKQNNNVSAYGARGAILKSKLGADGKIIERALDVGLSKLGVAFNTQLDKIIDNCPNEALKGIYLKLKDDLRVGDVAFPFTPRYEGGYLYLNIKDDEQESSEKHAWSYLVHEIAHAFDNMLCSDKNNFFSYKYKDGSIDKTLRKEVDNLIKKTTNNLYDNPTWLLRKGYIDVAQYNYYNENKNWGEYKPVLDERVGCDFLEEYMKMYSHADTMFISDILQGASDRKINGFYGHPLEEGKTDYWKEYDYRLAIEFFAEVSAAEMIGGESIELIQELLPESYAMYNEILTSMNDSIG